MKSEGYTLKIQAHKHLANLMYLIDLIDFKSPKSDFNLKKLEWFKTN